MKVSSVSTSAISNALRFSLLRAQQDLVNAQKESQTGSVADTGLALGTRTSVTMSFQRDMDRLNGIVDSNALVSARLKATQNSMSQISSSAQTFLSALTTTSSGSALSTVTQTAAATMLDQLTSILNSSFNGEQLFAGVNTDVKPIDDFNATGSPAKAAFDAAFQGYFGFAQSAPAAANITTSDMQNFLTTQVEPQFMGAGWQANWSTATDQTISSRITLTETTNTSVSANDDAFRKFMMTAATVKDMFDSNVGAGGRQAVIDWAISAVGAAVGELGTLQAVTGIAEKRVTDASDRLTVQSDLFQKQIGNMVNVDPYEAATRVNDLLSQIQNSYALTARIQQLSILNYLS